MVNPGNHRGASASVGALQITNQFTKWQRCTNSSCGACDSFTLEGKVPLNLEPSSVHRAPVPPRRGFFFVPRVLIGDDDDDY